MRRQRKTKIVATVGPSCQDLSDIKKIFLAGSDVFRINTSHISRSQFIKIVDNIRYVEKEVNRPIAIICDLQGPKLRIGDFSNDSKITIKEGKIFSFVLDSSIKGDMDQVSFPHPEVFKIIKEGDPFLLNDGNLIFKVTKVEKSKITAISKNDGILSSRKGVNLPKTVIPMKGLSEDDSQFIKLAQKNNCDWIALSYVQRTEDIDVLKKILGEKSKLSIISKIEKPAALDCIDDIIDKSDGIMIARGDLGVEMAIEQIPSVQKKIIRSSRKAGKPVIVATQMLDSMIHSPSPTRAEASDIATAVYDGVDAVMLSAETAVGEYAKDSVIIMDKIIQNIEKDSLYAEIMDPYLVKASPDPTDAITLAVREVANTVSASAIVAFSVSGRTAMRISRERPLVPVLGLTNNVTNARKISIAWGIHPVVDEDAHDGIEMIDKAIQNAKKEGFASSNDKIIITAGVPFGNAKHTNLLRVLDLATEDLK